MKDNWQHFQLFCQITCSAKLSEIDFKRAGEHSILTDVCKHSDIQVMKTYFRKSLNTGVRKYPAVLSYRSYSTI